MSDKTLSACPGRLKDKIAVVTAAAGGIGGATALRLARDGAKAVVAIDTSDGVKQIQEGIDAAGSEGVGIKLDCTDEKEVVATRRGTSPARISPSMAAARSTEPHTEMPAMRFSPAGQDAPLKAQASTGGSL